MRFLGNAPFPGDTLETQIAPVPLLPSRYELAPDSPTSAPVGLQGDASPGAGGREPERVFVTGAGRPRRWWHGARAGRWCLRLRAAPGVASSGGLVTDRRGQFFLLRGSARYTGQRMAWRFRKSLKLGPIRLNLSKSGVGYSIGGRGFCVGQDAKGRSYTAASIPGTGLYSREYSSQGNAVSEDTALMPKEVHGNVSGAAAKRNSGVSLAVWMLAAAFVAGGLVTLLLTALLSTPPAAPPVTPPAAVSAPITPPAPVKPAKKRRRGPHRIQR